MSDPVDPLAPLVEAFIAAMRAGNSPSIEALAQGHPHLAAEIREVFPGLIAMEGLHEAPETEQPLGPGTTVGGYRLLGELGRGGMGVVYEAEAVRGAPGQPRVALKLIHAHLLGRPSMEERFLREVRIGTRIVHEGVVRIHDTGLHSERVPFLVMDRVEGTTLGELATSMGGVVPEPLLRRITIDILRGLEAIHAEGIVHRDLKPANLMVTRDHRACIMDLGVARLIDDVDAISGTDLFVGSMRYSAPEQFDKTLGAVGAATDLYSLGVVLFELATGRHPFAGGDLHSLVLAHLNQAAPTVRSIEPGVSELFSELVAALLEKSPTARPATARVVGQALVDEASAGWLRERQRQQAAAASSLITWPRVRAQAPLAGRQDELAALRAACDSACAAQGRVVLLRGDAGLGKTRLLRELASSIAERPVRMLYSACSNGGADSVQAAALFEHMKGDELVTQLVADYLRRQETGAPDLASAAEVLLSVMDLLARDRPLVWVTDDLHRGSPRDLALLLAMARAAEAHRLLLVAVSSQPLPQAAEEELLLMPHASMVTLQPLDEVDIRGLIESAFGVEDWAEPLIERIAVESGGSPFLALELVREVERLRQEGRLGDASEIATSTLDRLPIPGVVRDLLLLRLGGLDEQQRGLIECAAFCGHEFDPELVAEVLGLEPLEALRSLAAVERSTGMVRSQGERMRFEHHQMHEIVLEELSPPLARAYHGRIARVLADRGAADPEAAILLAHHAFAGGEPELGLGVTLAALEALGARSREREGLIIADRALACVRDVRQRAEILVRKVRLLTNMLQDGGREELELSIEQLLACAAGSGVEELRALAMLEQGRALIATGRAVEAKEPLQQARQLAERQGVSGQLLDILVHLANCVSPEDGLVIGREALRVARELDDPIATAKCHLMLSSRESTRGHGPEAEAHALEAMGILDSAGVPGGDMLRGRVHWRLGFLDYYASRLQSAERHLRQALSISRRAGAVRWSLAILDVLAGVLYGRGRLGEAIVLFRDVETQQRRGGGSDRNSSLANVGGMLVAAGQLEEARTHLDDVLESLGGTDHRVRRLEAFVRVDLGRLCHLEGDVDDAVDHVQRAIDIRRSLGSEMLAPTLIVRGMLELVRERREPALAHMAEAASSAAATGDAASHALARAWQAFLGSGSADDIAVPANMLLATEVELRLLLGASGAGSENDVRAAELLDTFEASLADDSARAAFRRSSPLHRLRRLLLVLGEA